MIDQKYTPSFFMSKNRMKGMSTIIVDLVYNMKLYIV